MTRLKTNSSSSIVRFRFYVSRAIPPVWIDSTRGQQLLNKQPEIEIYTRFTHIRTTHMITNKGGTAIKSPEGKCS